MFEFKANIIKRRKWKKSSLLMSLIAVLLLGYTGVTFFEKGFVPYIEAAISQIGIEAFSTWAYLGVFALLIVMTLPTVLNIFRKKSRVGGTVSFDEEKLEIKKGREHLVIPESELSQLNFELKQLPEEGKKSKDKLFGGSYMKIPTTKGTFECELDINNKQDRDKLMNMIEFLKIEHDVKVSLKEIK